MYLGEFWNQLDKFLPIVIIIKSGLFSLKTFTCTINDHLKV